MTKPTIQQIFQEKKTAFEALGFSILGDEDAAKEVVQIVFVNDCDSNVISLNKQQDGIDVISCMPVL